MAKSFRRNYRQKLKDAIEDVLDGGLEEEATELAEAAIRYAEEMTSEKLGLVNTDAFDSAIIRFFCEQECHFSPNSLVGRARDRAIRTTDRDTYQAMEGFVHNLNTMHSRAGAQV